MSAQGALSVGRSQMVLCGYGNCQPTTWTREVPVQVHNPPPFIGFHTEWVKEVVTGVVATAGAFVLGCSFAVVGLYVAVDLTAPGEGSLNVGGNQYAITCIASGVSSLLSSLNWKI